MASGYRRIVVQWIMACGYCMIVVHWTMAPEYCMLVVKWTMNKCNQFNICSSIMYSCIDVADTGQKLVTGCQWSMVNGQWSMVNDQWSMVYGN